MLTAFVLDSARWYLGRIAELTGAASLELVISRQRKPKPITTVATVADGRTVSSVTLNDDQAANTVYVRDVFRAVIADVAARRVRVESEGR